MANRPFQERKREHRHGNVTSMSNVTELVISNREKSKNHAKMSRLFALLPCMLEALANLDFQLIETLCR